LSFISSFHWGSPPLTLPQLYALFQEVGKKNQKQPEGSLPQSYPQILAEKQKMRREKFPPNHPEVKDYVANLNEDQKRHFYGIWSLS